MKCACEKVHCVRFVFHGTCSVAVIQTCTVEPLPEDPDRFQGQNVAETIRG